MACQAVVISVHVWIVGNNDSKLFGLPFVAFHISSLFPTITIPTPFLFWKYLEPQALFTWNVKKIDTCTTESFLAIISSGIKSILN